jgi:chromosomal replication initiator protein
VDTVLAHFSADVEMLKSLANKAGELDPAAAGHARFRDPDRLAEAQAFVQKLNDGIIPPPAPISSLTLGDYIGGSANEAVVRAARVVTQDPGRKYNPLYITGPSGVGKTHLLHAIGNALAAGEPPRVVACLSAQAFIEDLLSAIEGGNVEWWRRRYRRADAFLLDDTQLISGKEQTQDELFNLFNVLAEAEKQLVFAADRPPGELENVSARLVTRFEGGLVVELAAPDRTMRLFRDGSVRPETDAGGRAHGDRRPRGARVAGAGDQLRDSRRPRSGAEQPRKTAVGLARNR